MYTKTTKEVGSSYWKKNEGVKQGKFLRVILTALVPKEKPICSLLGMGGCGSMHACACRYVYVRGKRTVSGIVPLTSDLGSICVCLCRLALQVCTSVNNFFLTWILGIKLGSKQSILAMKLIAPAVCFMLVLEFLTQAIPNLSFPSCWDNRHAPLFYSCSFGFK